MRLKTLKKITSALIISSSLLIFSCSKDNGVDVLGEGSIRVVLGTDTTTNVVAGYSADATTPEWQDPNNYRVEIYSGTTLYASFKKFSDIPADGIIRLKLGEYNFKATWGTLKTAAFDSPCFEGTKKFKLENVGSAIDVNVVCKLSNAKLTVSYSDSFKEAFKDYADYYVEAYSGYSRSPLVFYKEETRAGYFKLDNIYLRIILEKKDGTSYAYGLEPISGIRAADNYRVILRASGSTPSTASVNINITNTVTEKSQDVDVPFVLFEKRAPKIKMSVPSPYAVAAGVVNTETGVTAYIQNDGQLNEITLDAANCKLFTDAGLEHISFKKALEDATYAQKLKDLGLSWELDFQNASKNFIHFTGILKPLSEYEGAGSGDNTFTLSVTDRYNQTDTKSFVIKVTQPQFTWPINIGEVYARYAVLHQIKEDDIIAGDYNVMKPKFVYEYSSDGGSSWNAINFNGKEDIILKGITPNSGHIFRARFEKFAYTSPNINTEQENTVPNGVMEGWSDDNKTFSWKCWTGFLTSYEAYITLKSVNNWSTNNANTIIKGNSGSWSSGGGEDASESLGLSGTRNITGTVGSGAIIETVKYERGTKIGVGFLRQEFAVSSRPTAVSYYYQNSIPQNGKMFTARIKVYSGATVIGTATKSYTDPQNSYAKETLKIDYTNKVLKADKVYIEFVSSQTESLTLEDAPIATGAKLSGTWGMIDEVNFVYDAPESL